MSQKYRHRGYRETEREERDHSKPPPRKELSTEERIHKRSLRKATNREANEVVRCHNCGWNVQDFGTIGPTTGCPKCNAPLHCCRVCRNFDSAARWQCRAEITQAVGDKGAANDCGKFQPRLVLDATGRRSKPSGQSSNDPRAQFENLFKR